MFVHVCTFIITSPFSLLHLFAGLVFVELPSCIVNIHWRQFFFSSLIYAGSVLQADQLLHGIFISFFCHRFTSLDDSE